MASFDENEIRKTLKIDARAIGIPSGAAEAFIDRALKSAKQTLKHKTIITENDLERTIAKELKKYNADFAYVFENRDKII